MAFEGVSGMQVFEDDIHTAVIKRDQAIGRDDESANASVYDHREENVKLCSSSNIVE
jgi:hypothetical protein